MDTVSCLVRTGPHICLGWYLRFSGTQHHRYQSIMILQVQDDDSVCFRIWSPKGLLQVDGFVYWYISLSYILGTVSGGHFDSPLTSTSFLFLHVSAV